MSNGLQCTDYNNAREQIIYIVRHYVLTHRVRIGLPVFDENINQYRCRVYVFLNEEDKNLSKWDYKGTLGFWGSYIGQINRDGALTAAYLFKWRG